MADSGLLESDEITIKAALIKYRREYKRQWKHTAQKNKTLRPVFTGAEFEGIVTRAKLYGLTPTTYGREIILANQAHTDLVPNKEQLIYVLQSVTMAAIAMSKGDRTSDVKELLMQAEEMLVKYLRFKQ